MATISSFISITLDGCYADASGGMNWAHRPDVDGEFAAFTSANAGGGQAGGGRLLFGRTTYEQMASFWPSQMAAQQMPDVAKAMNAMSKTVFSRTLASPGWQNTTVEPDLLDAAERLKKGGQDMVVLGSGSIVTQLADSGLLDELQVVLVPVTLGAGKRLFDGAKTLKAWRPVDTRAFKNGNVFVRYRPA